MTPLLIIKTANGFAAMPFTGEIPQADLSNLLVASALKPAYSYGKDGLLGLVEVHFTPATQPKLEPAPIQPPPVEAQAPELAETF